MPGWAVDNADSVRREAARYRGMRPDEKVELVASACRTAALLCALALGIWGVPRGTVDVDVNVFVDDDGLRMVASLMEDDVRVSKWDELVATFGRAAP